MITDVLMPVMDGYELLRQLRLDPATLPEPVPLATDFDRRHLGWLADKLSEEVSAVMVANGRSTTVINIATELASEEDSYRRVQTVCNGLPASYTEDAIVSRGVLHPGVAVLHKPSTSDSLVQKIREVLGK